MTFGLYFISVACDNIIVLVLCLDEEDTSSIEMVDELMILEEHKQTENDDIEDEVNVTDSMTSSAENIPACPVIPSSSEFEQVSNILCLPFSLVI